MLVNIGITTSLGVVLKLPNVATNQSPNLKQVIEAEEDGEDEESRSRFNLLLNTCHRFLQFFLDFF